MYLKNNGMLESKVKKQDRDVSFEEITDIPDVSIEYIDDDIIGVDVQSSEQNGIEYESITDIPLTERMSVEIVDDEKEITEFSNIDTIDDLDIESLSVEVDLIGEMEKTPVNNIGDRQKPVVIDIEEISADELDGVKQVDGEIDTDDITPGESEGDYPSGHRDVAGIEAQDTLDEILDIIEDESALSGVGRDIETGEGAGRAYREYRSKNAVSSEQEVYSKNRINGIEETDDILNDEFVILQSDLEDGEELVLGGDVRNDLTDAHTYDAGNRIDGSAAKKREKKINEIIIDISENEREKFSREFDIKSFKAFDLKEAEKIAREDIVFLSEDDLVEELQDIDLVPIEEMKEEIDIKIVTDDEEFQHNIDDIISEMEQEELHDSVKTRTTIVTDEDEEYKASGNLNDQKEESISDSHEVARELSGVDGPQAGIEEEKIFSDEIDETVVGNALVPELDELKVEHGVEETVSGASVPGTVLNTVVDDVDNEHEETDDGVILDEVISGDTINSGTTHDSVQVLETIPGEYSSLTSDENIYIIDDENVQSGERKTENYIFEESELEKITANMVEVVEGDSRVLKEANVEDDKDNIASIMSGSAPAFEDLLIDFSDEYSFIDEKTEYVDDTFISNEYREAEKNRKKSGSKDVVSQQMTHTIEILGLSNIEIGSIEGAVFLKEFENIDLSALEFAAKPGYDAGVDDRELIARYDYIALGTVSLNTVEKRSIEEDIYGNNALIFEENVRDIEDKLSSLEEDRLQKTGEPGTDREEIYDISDNVFILDNEEDVTRFTESLQEDKQQQIRVLLKYLDGLFEKLPEDVIKKFAESEYFTLYAQVLNELDRQ